MKGEKRSEVMKEMTKEIYRGKERDGGKRSIVGKERGEGRKI